MFPASIFCDVRIFIQRLVFLRLVQYVKFNKTHSRSSSVLSHDLATHTSCDASPAGFAVNGMTILNRKNLSRFRFVIILYVLPEKSLVLAMYSLLPAYLCHFRRYHTVLHYLFCQRSLFGRVLSCTEKLSWFV